MHGAAPRSPSGRRGGPRSRPPLRVIDGTSSRAGTSPAPTARKARPRAAFFLPFLLVGPFLSCRKERDVFPDAPVVLICVDTLRADHLPAYVSKGVDTPALDALAWDAVVFENAIAQVPLTLPSHASLFTGLLPFQNGVRDNVGYRLGQDRATLASLLRGRGYATGGAVLAFVLDHTTGIASGFDFYEDRVEARQSGQAIGEVQRPGAETERLLERWIDSLPAGRPFLAFLHLYEPHAPYSPPEPFATRYAGRLYDGERSPRPTRSSGLSSGSSRRRRSTIVPSSSSFPTTARAWETTGRTSTGSSSTARRSGFLSSSSCPAPVGGGSARDGWRRSWTCCPPSSGPRAARSRRSCPAARCWTTQGDPPSGRSTARRSTRGCTLAGATSPRSRMGASTTCTPPAPSSTTGPRTPRREGTSPPSSPLPSARCASSWPR